MPPPFAFTPPLTAVNQHLDLLHRSQLEAQNCTMGTISFVATLLLIVHAVSGRSRGVSDTQKLVEANNEFAMGLYKAAVNKENVIISPFSVSNALGMLYLGARKSTAKEMSQVLGYSTRGLQDERVHSSFQEVLNLFKGSNKAYVLNIANKALVRKDQPLKSEYKNAVQNYYDTEVENVDFATQSDQILKEINQWVKDKTNAKIDKLLSKPLDPNFTALVLLNAVYFKGTWKTQFDPEFTQQKTFKNEDGTSTQVEMMTRKGTYNYTYSEELESDLLEIPYSGDDISLVILLPNNAVTLKDLEKSLTVERLSKALEDLDEETIRVTIPKFKLEAQYNLKELLQKLGMNEVFGSNADLSGMVEGAQDLYVSDAQHKAVIEVNEEGTEAAGGTAVVIENRMLTPSFVANRPFMFLIRDRRSDAILFLGSVRHL